MEASLDWRGGSVVESTCCSAVLPFPALPVQACLVPGVLAKDTIAGAKHQDGKQGREDPEFELRSLSLAASAFAY